MWTLRRNNVLAVIVIIIIAAPRDGDCACTYPSALDGVFYSSHDGYITWNNTTFGQYTVTTFSQTFANLEYECHLNDGNYYIGRSASFTIYTGPFYAYICLELHRVSDNLFYYYYATTELSGANGARVKILPTSTSVTSAASICDEPTPYDDGTFSILYRNGTSISTEATTCPTDLQGYYFYTLNDGTTTHCNNGSYLDVCADTKSLTFNYTECNTTNALYSAGGQLYCLYSQNTSSTHYVILYNADASVDDSTTYQTVCMVLQKDSSGVGYATQYPKECQNTTLMNSTAVASPGASLILTLNDSCPVATTTVTPAPVEQTNTASVIGGTLGTLIILAAAVVVFLGVLWWIKNKNTSSKVDKAEDKAEDKEEIIPQGHGDINSRTLFTPTNKIPLERDNEIISQRHIRTSFDDADGTAGGEGESITNEYGEIQADEIMIVSEGTTVSNDQMTEASLPMSSEGGETPQPTEVTPPGVVNEDVESAQATARTPRD
ncbi:uncharacterized protein [Haliotis cracherodii]|uniref:uncharacterized protein n=1 Tax=Haliotis cracherodii TaxID=6455 RepID=UPI0039EC786D